MAKLAPCPLCGFSPRLAYCFGEYLVIGKYDYCPVCGDAFTEMHSNEQMEVEAWNMRIDWWNNLGGACNV